VLRIMTRLVVVLVVVAVGFGTWIFLGFDHSIPNGAEIAHEVLGIRGAVPKNALNVHEQSSSASWIRGCSQIPGAHSGWSTDEAGITFKDTDPHSVVVGSVSRSLRRAGYKRDDSMSNRHEGRTPHWTLDVQSAHLVQVWLFPVVRKTHEWYLSASWRPRGPVGQGCP
jgi:hypothetical protein